MASKTVPDATHGTLVSRVLIVPAALCAGLLACADPPPEPVALVTMDEASAALSELVYMLDAEMQVVDGEVAFETTRPFQVVDLKLTIDGPPVLEFQLVSAGGETHWAPLPVDGEGRFYSTRLEVEGEATALRLRNATGLDFARLEFFVDLHAAHFDDDVAALGDTGEIAKDARAGRWSVPGGVRAQGLAQHVNYTGAPSWSGGRNCSGNLTAGARRLGELLVERFPGARHFEGYACRQIRGSSGMSVHGTGRAVDVFVPLDGGQADNDLGDPVANWLIENAEQIGVQLIIWDRTIWNGSRRADQDRRYGGSHAHHDHLHIEITPQAARLETPFFDGGAEPRAPLAWVGTVCEDDTGCDFGAGQRGSCQRYPGGAMCTVSCEGLCPDRAGFAPTFCVSASMFGEAEDFGVCAVKPAAQNARCGSLDGMSAQRAARHLGQSGAAARMSDVCLPVVRGAPPPEEPPPPEDPPPRDEPPPREDPPPRDPPEDPPVGEPEEAPLAPGTWVGDPCRADGGCAFLADGRRARCFRDHRPADGVGFCVLDCAGLCPDRDGRAPTFCAPVSQLANADGGGACVEQVHALNAACQTRCGMHAANVTRYVGNSGVRARQADICAPDRAPAPPDRGGLNGGVCDEPDLPLSDNGAACPGVPHNTWRCACSGRWESPISQVCRDGRWTTFQLNPSDCSRCDGAYTAGCAP